MLIQTSIDSVMVFKHSAIVKRTGKIPPLNKTEGIVNLYIQGLPLLLEDPSLRVGIRGKSSWAVRNVRTEIDRTEKEPHGEREEKLKNLEKENTRINREASFLCEQIGEVNKWLNMAGEKTRKITFPSVCDINREMKVFHLKPWLNFIKTCRTYLERLLVKEEDLRLKSWKINKEIEITREFSPLEYKKEDIMRIFHKNLIITLGSLDRKEFPPEEIEISYIIPGSQWMPAYKLYIQDNYKRVKLVIGGQVAQKTGEYWDKAQVSFSMAMIERRTQLPDLPSQLIGRTQQKKPESFRPKVPVPSGICEDFQEWLKEAKSDIAMEKSPSRELMDKCLEKCNELKETPHVPMMPPARPDVSHVDYPKSLPLAGKPQESVVHLMIPPKEYGKDKDIAAKKQYIPQSASGTIKVDLLPTERRSSGLFNIAGEVMNNVASLLPPTPSPEYLKSLDIEMKDRYDYSNYELRSQEETSVEYRGILKKVRTISITERVREPENILLEILNKAKEGTVTDRYETGKKGSFHSVIEGKGRASIPSDGLFHAVDLMAEEAVSSLEYSTIPMTEQKVFRRITIENPFDVPLPGGSVQVFLDNVYTLTTEVKDVGPGGKAIFPLGVEENLKVSRNTSFYQEERGLMGGLSAAIHMVEFEIRSHMAEPVTIEVIERLPVPAFPDINVNVKMTKSAPEFIEDKKETGLYKCKIPLEPGSVGSAKIEYEITVPSKMEIRDGNRRI